MLGTCLVFRNAAPYLREWLLFHIAVGFDRFYLYNNDSTDEFRPILAPFTSLAHDNGPIIELIDWPGYKQQLSIYNDCLKRAKGVKWLAFIDDDEFLYPVGNQLLPQILQKFDPFAGVAVCWQLYGSSGRIYREDDWVIRRFKHRAASPDQHVKCIVQPTRVVKALVSGHLFEPKSGYVVVDERMQPLQSVCTPHPSTDVLRMNHYVTKSIEEMIIRRTSREVDNGDNQKLSLAEWIRLDRGWNAIEDSSALTLESRMMQLAVQLRSQ